MFKNAIIHKKKELKKKHFVKNVNNLFFLENNFFLFLKNENIYILNNNIKKSFFLNIIKKNEKRGK